MPKIRYDEELTAFSSLFKCINVIKRRRIFHGLTDFLPNNVSIYRVLFDEWSISEPPNMNLIVNESWSE